jgi:putative FmdB family regulatory protein
MPLYEYRCKSCDEREERLEGFDAPTRHDCPQCGAALAMHREVSLTSFTLSGGGWESQGYGKGSAGKAKDGIPVPAKADAAATPAATPAPAPAGGCAGGCACHTGKPAK